MNNYKEIIVEIDLQMIKIIKLSEKYSLFYFIVMMDGVHCGICKGSYNISNISYSNSLLLPSSFISASPYLRNSFSRYPFSVYISVHSICNKFTLLHPFPTSFLFPLISTSLGRTFFSLPPFSNFATEKKKMTFLLKIATQGISLWYFQVICIIA
jgi:hypothetical protein